MMRLLVFLILLLFIIAGIVLAALNAEAVKYDLFFGRVLLPKGAALLMALVLGWLLGGVTAWFGMVWRWRRRLRGKNTPDPTHT